MSTFADSKGGIAAVEEKKTGIYLRRASSQAIAALLLALCAISGVRAQSPTNPPVLIAPPVVDAIDENDVSILSGEEQFTIPAIKMGDVAFTPFSYNYSHFGVATDENYGRIADCQSSSGVQTQPGTSECTALGSGIQAIYGEQRGTFDYVAGKYQGEADDGSTFVDNGTTCTWTQRDGTQIVYTAYHATGNQMCQSNNIAEVIRPDGRITTYYYYGTPSTTYDTPSPILSIATNSGYMLKYNYSGTPSWGTETSVVAINRAFQTCNPAALSCSLTQTWPTATLTWKSLGANTEDPATPATSLTIQDEAGRHYVFGIDSDARVAWYQPPEATQPVYYYSLCTLERDSVTLENCFGMTTWTHNPVFDIVPVIWDWVNSVKKMDYATGNSATWTYGYNLLLSGGPCPDVGCSILGHTVASPLGVSMQSSGNMTGGNTYSFYGPTDSITQYDGTVDHYERNTQNYVSSQLTPLGLLTSYGYDSRGNLQAVTKTPIPGKGQSPISEGASYPATCTSLLTCNEPTSTTDFRTYSWTFTYDPANGEVWTQTGPAVNGVQPQNRYTYIQLNAWYLSSAGVMTEDPNPIWVPASESYCMTGAAVAPGPAGSPPAPPGAGCTKGNDEVVTSYDYGPQSGPNNLLMRGKTVTAQGQTLRTCYGHDPEGNKLWETSPNANPSSCPSY